MPTPKAKKPAAKPTKKPAPKAVAKTAKPAAKAAPKKAAPKATKPAAKAAPKKVAAKKPIKVTKPAAKVAPKKTAAKPVVKKAAPKAATKPIAKTTTKSASPKSAPVAKKSVPVKAEKPSKVSTNVTKAKRVTTDSSLQIRGVEPYNAKKGEAYMGKAQLAHFTQILNGWKQELMEEVDRTVHHMQDEAANYPDVSDRASQEEEFSLELRARDRERKLIKKINEMLERIEKDDYGYCDSCGVEIGVRRLEARPTAALCIDCKTLDEIKEKQIKG